ncbi:MAG: hypothetical protein IKT00_13055 [Prevotella sp.]|nr:hypothetical protein [Prevotella sp.]
MRKAFVVLCLLFTFCQVSIGQSITTIVEIPFNVETQQFIKGDTIVVYGYKKKSDEYHFIIEKGYYVGKIHSAFNPFAVEEKTLKKLPSATSSDMNVFISSRDSELKKLEKEAIKQKALNGDYVNVVSRLVYFEESRDCVGALSRGDSIHIVGKSGLDYAAYTDYCTGIFRISSPTLAFDKVVNYDLLPSIDDNEVQAMLTSKRMGIRQTFRESALNGTLKVVKGVGALYDLDGNFSNFSNNDTISLVGYSFKDGVHLLALYNDKDVGFFTSEADPTSFLVGNFDLNLLPSTDEPEVKSVIEEELKRFNDALKVELEESRKQLSETITQVVSLFKSKNPVLVKVKGWSMNSVGGITASFRVTNCSPSQTIKYITIQGNFTNAVGDRCRNEIGGSTIWRVKGIGPIGPCPTSEEDFMARIDGCDGSYEFDCFYYCETAHYMHVTSIIIQYMSGKTVTISGNKIDNHVSFQ